MIYRYKKNIVIAAFVIYFTLGSLYQSNEDVVILFMMSLLFSGGLFGLLSSIDYLFFKNKVNATVSNRKMNAGATLGDNGSGSFSRGYRYSFLIDSQKYQMPPRIGFGSKYEESETVKVIITNEEEHYVLPVRLVYNILFVSIISIISSIT
jgi:hypothetical protein